MQTPQQTITFALPLCPRLVLVLPKPPHPRSINLPRTGTSQRVCGAQPAVHGGSRAVREAAAAAPAGLRGKARRGYGGDRRNAQGVPGLVYPGQWILLYDAFAEASGRETTDEVYVSERLWNLQSCPRCFRPLLLAFCVYLSSNPMQTTDIRRWKWPQRIARCSQWSPALARYASILFSLRCACHIVFDIREAPV